MVDVVIYSAGPKGILKEVSRFSEQETLQEAKGILLEMFKVYADCAEWNIKKASINTTFTEGHIYGYCRDEHHLLVLEDPGKQDVMEAWNDRLEKLNTKRMA